MLNCASCTITDSNIVDNIVLASGFGNQVFGVTLVIQAQGCGASGDLVSPRRRAIVGLARLLSRLNDCARKIGV